MAATVSRRGFARLLGAGVTLAALPGGRSAAMRLSDPVPPALPPRRGPILLNANENPYGPSPASLAAMRDAVPFSCRYPDEQAEALAAAVAAHLRLPVDHVLLGEGSSEILKLAVTAGAGPNRRVVVADPTFEAVGVYAANAGMEVAKVPLTADFRHPLDAMRSLARGAGLVYVCNPNNPTASVTPAAELRAFLAAVPPETVVLVDEAYHHF
ncbi:MAG TPA: aminotransferase class I/II-fold pyridoxal phosphate-dependent enzyme, partial [Thermoanaerobaculia bacterium]|nr:aminotransferase class I/II-fold pyridoxal phosphate-dependent enzyme [Thermoanaerobaculia bacterium]